LRSALEEMHGTLVLNIGGPKDLLDIILIKVIFFTVLNNFREDFVT